MRVSILELRRGLDQVSDVDSAADLALPADWFSQPVEIRARIHAVPGGWSLELAILTRARRICDRCLAELDLAVEEQERCLILETGHSAGVEDEDRVLQVAPDQEWAELDQIVRDALVLSQPEYVLCRQECLGLCPVCGQNLNDGDCGCRPPAPDSPLLVLAGLKRPD